jgi:hypothetical protein
MTAFAFAIAIRVATATASGHFIPICLLPMSREPPAAPSVSTLRSHPSMKILTIVIVLESRKSVTVTTQAWRRGMRVQKRKKERKADGHNLDIFCFWVFGRPRFYRYLIF